MPKRKIAILLYSDEPFKQPATVFNFMGALTQIDKKANKHDCVNYSNLDIVDIASNKLGICLHRIPGGGGGGTPVLQYVSYLGKCGWEGYGISGS